MASPTTTHREKITHAVTVLGAAGPDDSQNKAAQGTATTTHGEKITHAVGVLSNAGLSNNSSHSGLGDKKWIIIGAAVGGVVLLVILILLFIFIRARRRRRAGAYASMGRGIDMKENDTGNHNGSNPAQGAPPQPGMRGFLMPAWSSSKGKGKDLGPQGEAALRGPSMDIDLSSRGPSFDASYENRGRGLSMDAGRSRSRDPSRHSRSRSRGPNLGLQDDNSRDVFNAEKEMMPSEGDSMLIGGPKIAERNFESGYEAMDTEYRSGGDKRSGFGA